MVTLAFDIQTLLRMVIQGSEEDHAPLCLYINCSQLRLQLA